MSRYHVIYDDTCPLCLTGIEQIRKLDRLGLVSFVPLSGVPEQSGSRMPSREKLKQQMHLITPEGKVYRGAEAAGLLATLFPSSRLLGEFILLPGVRHLARHVYRLIARHRLRISRLAALN